MTTRRPDDAANGALRDPRFDAAWRKLSSEEPPPALDAAIRAAARREVGAGPRSAATRIPNALRPQRWWWPLAAAATIGAIVVGILQLASPEHVAPTPDTGVVSDVPTASKPAQRDAAVERAAPPAEPPAPRKQARAREDERAPEAPTPTATPAQSAVEEKAAKPVATAAPLAEPFPGAAGPRASHEHAAAPPRRAEPAPSRGVLGGADVQDKLAGPVPRTAAKAEEPPSSMPASPATAYSSEGRAAAKREVQAQRAASTSLEQSRAAPSEAAPSGARAKDSSAPAVPDWIALIRKLRDEGRSDEAAKELAAFRSAHPNHEQLLPPDLRDWRPATR